jgi:hypothetical protein
MMPFSLTDNQLHAVMLACTPLDPSKRCTAMERIAGHLRNLGIRHPNDHDVERAIHAAMNGLLQVPADV